jgi:pyrroloquinoline quinone biosynthesis protein B
VAFKPRFVPILATVVALCGCGAPDSSSESSDIDAGPYLVALGTAQDGGLPHAGCGCPHCAAARQDPSRRRLIASVAIVLPESSRVFLIDVTPDVREQLEVLREAGDAPDGVVDRAPVDGAFITHAHMGHYLGLAFFGFEAIHTRDLPVYATSSVVSYLENNGPWDQTVRLRNIAPVEVAPGASVDLGEGVTVIPVAVPHRDEYTDTVGFLIRGPRRQVLYAPDTDGWDAWDPPVTDRLATLDVAILDGTFFSADELLDRDLASIGHPLIVDSMGLLAPVVAAGATRVCFTHLNHSNPAVIPGGPAAREIAARGFCVLEDGQRFPL